MPVVEGTPIWFELNATDADTAHAFYEAVADWRVTPFPMPEHGGHRIAEADGRPVAGIRRRCRKRLASRAGPSISRSRTSTPPPPGWWISAARSGSGPWTSRMSAASPWSADHQDVYFALMAAAAPTESRSFGAVPPWDGADLRARRMGRTRNPRSRGCLHVLWGAVRLGETRGHADGEDGRVRLHGPGRPASGRGDVERSRRRTGPVELVRPRARHRCRARDRSWKGRHGAPGARPDPGCSHSANIADPAGNWLGLAGQRRTS